MKLPDEKETLQLIEKTSKELDALWFWQSKQKYMLSSRLVGLYGRLRYLREFC
jgi:hypothetical protein